MDCPVRLPPLSARAREAMNNFEIKYYFNYDPCMAPIVKLQDNKLVVVNPATVSHWQWYNYYLAGLEAAKRPLKSKM